MKDFPLTAAIFEGCLVPAAIALGWLLGTPPLATFHLEWRDALIGLAATLPPLGLFWLCLTCRWRPFAEIAKIMDDTLLPMLRDCPIVKLAVIATLAGLGEEMLFRGVVQTALAETIGGPYGAWLGLLAAAVTFGLLHAITPTYAILAGVVGLYLGGLWLACGNLLAPIVTHGTYDLLALAYLIKLRGGEERPESQNQ